MKHNKAENNSNNNNFNPPLMVLHLSGCDDCVECEYVCVLYSDSVITKRYTRICLRWTMSVIL